MNRAKLGMVLTSTALLAGCATEWDSSYDRWYGYMAEPGPYRPWAHCIRQRSFHHIDPEGQGAIASNHGQLFTNVLADCREHMSGSAWEHISEDQVAELIADAYREFDRVYVNIQAHYAAGIISEAQN